MNSAIEKLCRFQLDRYRYIRQFDTVFQRPIRNGYDALPVGNGDLAAIVWQPDHLTWMLNKSDLSGEASQVARLIFERPVKLADRAGRLESRLSLADAEVTVTYTGGKFSDQDTTLPPGTPGVWRGIYRVLPVPTEKDRGALRVHGYVPYGANTLLIEYEENLHTPDPLSIVFERWIQESWGEDVKAFVQGRTFVITYRLKNGQSYAAVLAYDGFDGAEPVTEGALRLALKISRGRMTGGRLAVAVVTGGESANPLETATRLAGETLTRNSATLRRGHRRNWASFWKRSLVDAGHPYANTLYHMALYELGITSRGKRPVKFNGALNLWSERERVWGEGYTFHNQHSTYIPVYTANHAELARDFLEWIIRVRPQAVEAARKIFGVAGAYYPEHLAHQFTVAEAEKFTGPNREYELAYILSTGTRCALLLWRYYRYTLDTAFLRRAYPVIRDAAEFYVQYGRKGRDGRYHTEPSLSWEQKPVGRDGHADCAAWRAIFSMAVEAAVTLGVDAGKTKIWRERLRHAPPYPVQDGVFSAVRRRDGTPEPVDHFQWQIPNISSVYPYSVIGLDSPAPLRKTAAATFERYQFNADAGHEYLPVVAARLGRSDWWRSATFQFIQNFQVFDQGLFNYYDISGSRDEESENRQLLHPYLESSGIFAEAVNEMLIQSHGGVIRVFPAIPDFWHGRFILRAEGSFLVASEHRGKSGVPYVIVQALGGASRVCRLVLPWRDGKVRAATGRPVSFQQKGRTLVFSCQPGKIYVITPKKTDIPGVPVVRIIPQAAYSPVRFGGAWYGNSEGAEYHNPEFPLW